MLLLRSITWNTRKQHQLKSCWSPKKVGKKRNWNDIYVFFEVACAKRFKLCRFWNSPYIIFICTLNNAQHWILFIPWKVNFTQRFKKCFMSPFQFAYILTRKCSAALPSTVYRRRNNYCYVINMWCLVCLWFAFTYLCNITRKNCHMQHCLRNDHLKLHFGR